MLFIEFGKTFSFMNKNIIVLVFSRELSENIALEKFKWNSGGAETIYDEKTGIFSLYITYI